MFESTEESINSPYEISHQVQYSEYPSGPASPSPRIPSAVGRTSTVSHDATAPPHAFARTQPAPATGHFAGGPETFNPSRTAPARTSFNAPYPQAYEYPEPPQPARRAGPGYLNPELGGFGVTLPAHRIPAHPGATGKWGSPNGGGRDPRSNADDSPQSAASRGGYQQGVLNTDSETPSSGSQQPSQLRWSTASPAWEPPNSMFGATVPEGFAATQGYPGMQGSPGTQGYLPEWVTQGRFPGGAGGGFPPGSWARPPHEGLVATGRSYMNASGQVVPEWVPAERFHDISEFARVSPGWTDVPAVASPDGGATQSLPEWATARQFAVPAGGAAAQMARAGSMSVKSGHAGSAQIALSQKFQEAHEYTSREELIGAVQSISPEDRHRLAEYST